jgi:hypothetical protein
VPHVARIIVLLVCASCYSNNCFVGMWLMLPIPVTAQSKAWVYGRLLTGIVGSNPARGMDVSCECCVLSDRGLCGGPITRPAESYQVWCV